MLRKYLMILVFVLIHCACANVYAQLTISEIYPAPSEGPEWVELFNDSPESLDLTRYSLRDAVGKVISIPGSVLAPHSYILATSSSILNNSGDTLYLTFEPDGSQIIARYAGTVTFEESFIECDAEWVLTMNITPGYENPLCIAPEPTLTPTTAPTPTQKTSPTHKPIPQSFPTPSITPSGKSEKEVLALALSATHKPTPQSFSAKHAPASYNSTSGAPGDHASGVLGVQNTITPTAQPNLTAIPLRSESAQSSGIALGSLLLILAGFGYAGYRLYQEFRLARSQKDPYNEESPADSGSGPSSGKADDKSNYDGIRDPG